MQVGVYAVCELGILDVLFCRMMHLQALLAVLGKCLSDTDNSESNTHDWLQHCPHVLPQPMSALMYLLISDD